LSKTDLERNRWMSQQMIKKLTQFGKRTFEFEFEGLNIECKSLSIEDEIKILEEIGDFQRVPELYMREYQVRALAKIVQKIDGTFCGVVKEDNIEDSDTVKEKYLHEEFLKWDLDIFSALWMATQSRLKLYLGKVVDKYGIETFLTPEELKYAELVEIMNDIKREKAEE